MASSSEKIIAYHISRLKDKRPDVQLEAIRELEAMGSGAEGALEALKQCFEDSDDPGVKQAAQVAGYKIYMAVKDSQGG